MSSGWIKINRSILEHWVFTDEVVFKIWMYLLLKANHEDGKIMFDGELITIQRGQHLTSIRKIATEVKCSRSKVTRTLELMQHEKMLEEKCFKSGTLLTIVNYEVYQCGEPQKSHQKATERPPSEPPKSLNKNNKENKKNKEIEKELTEKEKLTFGETNNVYLTEAEYSKLVAERGKASTDNAINFLGYYKIEKGYKTRSDYLTIKRWVMDAANKNQKTEPQKIDSAEQRNDEPREEEHEISDEEWLALP